MSLSYDLACAESDVAHINLNKEYDELITDIEAVYNSYRYTFKNALGEDSGEIIDLLIEYCKDDIFAYSALIYVYCVVAGFSKDSFMSYTNTYKQTLKKLREEAQRDEILHTKEAC
nr:MAG TPA: hypothetical protein [Caudoviricetes sp.]